MNEQSIKDVKLILQQHQGIEPEHVGVYEGDSDYYIECKIAEHYVDATLIEEFEAIGLKIHSFQLLNGKYGQTMQFCLGGDLKS